MKYALKVDPNKLYIYHETQKRKIYVGDLTHDTEKDVYILRYDPKYANSSEAIPIGPHLPLYKETHISEKGELFQSLMDRIPERANPAYPDYCHHTGISVDETNKIILLGTIGKRGPSTFMFEKAYITDFNVEVIKKARAELDISQRDFARALGISQVTLQKIEAGDSTDEKTLKVLQLYFSFPEVARWQLKQTGRNVHRFVLRKLLDYFKQSS